MYEYIYICTPLITWAYKQESTEKLESRAFSPRLLRIGRLSALISIGFPLKRPLKLDSPQITQGGGWQRLRRPPKIAFESFPRTILVTCREPNCLLYFRDIGHTCRVLCPGLWRPRWAGRTTYFRPWAHMGAQGTLKGTQSGSRIATRTPQWLQIEPRWVKNHKIDKKIQKKHPNL